MSTEFLDVFFPHTSQWLRSKRSHIFTQLFPPDLQEVCFKPTLEVPESLAGKHMVISWPTLVPVVLLGIALGVTGCVSLSARAQHKSRIDRSLFAWPLAMAFYALMNLAALFSHCLLPRSSSWQHLAISADVAATGCCSFCALCACMGNDLAACGGWCGGDGGNSSGGGGRRDAAGRLVVVVGVGAIMIAAFLGSHIPFMPELLYIGITVLSAAVVGRHLTSRQRQRRLSYPQQLNFHQQPQQWQQLQQRLHMQQGRYLVLLLSGALLALSGVPLDATLCRLLGNGHVNHVTLLFAGCHVMILALYLYVRAEVRVMRLVQYDNDSDDCYRSSSSYSCSNPAGNGVSVEVSLGGMPSFSGTGVRQRGMGK